jgi:hypothetical protein
MIDRFASEMTIIDRRKFRHGTRTIASLVLSTSQRAALTATSMLHALHAHKRSSDSVI